MSSVTAVEVVNVAENSREICEGEGAGGWRFRAHVSASDGLVLDESSLNGRVYTKAVSAPYLEGFTTVTEPMQSGDVFSIGQPRQTQHQTKLELTPEPARAHDGVTGSTLFDFDCVDTGSGDIYAKAVYHFPGFLGADDSVLSGGLFVTQEYRFRGADEHRCEPTGQMNPCARFWPSLSYDVQPTVRCTNGAVGTDCPDFDGLSTVQRIEFRPDDRDGGAVNAFRDTQGTGGPGVLAGVQSKGDGAMKYEDVDNAIREGRSGDWDSIHVSPNSTTSFPGTNIFDLKPGCGECVHMHWTWRKITNVVNPFKDFTDGNPQLKEGSTQTADFGIVRVEPDHPEEIDPVDPGWRSLVDEKGSKASMLTGHNSVVFWEMSSTSRSDATFPVLDTYQHGGNGALFFGGEHEH